MMEAPFPPLAPAGEGLERPPAAPVALRARMAAVYGVEEAALLPVRGRLHALELVMRRIALDGAECVALAPAPELEQLARVTRLRVVADVAPGVGALVLRRPGPNALSWDEVSASAAAIAPGLLVLDESLIDFADAPSFARAATASANLLVVRSLEYAYGLAGAPCAALIAAPDLIARFEAVLEPQWLPTPIERLALAALDPSRIAATERRIGEVKAERARIAMALAEMRDVDAEQGVGPVVFASPRDPETARQRLREFGARGQWLADGRFRIDVALAPELNDRALAAFGAPTAARARRRAEVVRDTNETRIVVQVDLDAAARPQVDTGVGYFDHMLEQVASHGGFSLALSCAGDLHIDAHHSIEDCAIALGQALKAALGERRGIARFGFVLPMDEAEAKVSVDLSGRPYLVFEGAFQASALGEYPTEMTEHVFRSLAQSMGAAIHVAVTGENDHHKTEACFKALGRALRQAVRIEGEAIPSTKGAL